MTGARSGSHPRRAPCRRTAAPANRVRRPHQGEVGLPRRRRPRARPPRPAPWGRRRRSGSARQWVAQPRSQAAAACGSWPPPTARIRRREGPSGNHRHGVLAHLGSTRLVPVGGGGIADEALQRGAFQVVRHDFALGEGTKRPRSTTSRRLLNDKASYLVERRCGLTVAHEREAGRASPPHQAMGSSCMP